MIDRSTVIETVKNSECFKAEVAYAERGGYTVSPEPRLYKELDDGDVRVVFPVDNECLQMGSIVAITCLYDSRKEVNVYGHTICAGPGVNALLRAIHAPLGTATAQPGIAGEKATLQFIAWKKAAWTKFLNDELEMGRRKASSVWQRNFWKALDRMFGGGVLSNCPEDYHWREEE